MKYLRTYEIFEWIKKRKIKKFLESSPYKIGDYFLLLYNKGEMMGEDIMRIGKIIDIEFFDQISSLGYSVEFADGVIKTYFYDEIDHERKATMKEIEEYELEKDTNKYNL